jgi:choline transport protein
LIGGANLPPAQWSLGRYGIWINGVGFFYSFFVLFWAGWPSAKEITVETFNWSPVMFVGVFIFSVVYYIVWGHKTYAGPVVLVRQSK